MSVQAPQSPTIAAPTNGAVSPAAVPQQEAAEPTRRRLPRRLIVLPVVLIVLLVGGYFGYNAYRESLLYVSTENAQLTGQLIQVGSMNAGQVVAVTPTIGATVRRGDVVAQVALPSQVGVTQTGQPKLDFLGASDTRIDVKAPFDGVVVTNPAAVGANVAAGQAIVTLADPSQLWVIANIEETSIGKVKLGQPVTVHVDALNTDIPGRVEAITPATAGMMSILPTSNSSGNFTKVTQLVPVRISVNLTNRPLLLGANVEVKIRVAE